MLSEVAKAICNFFCEIFLKQRESGNPFSQIPYFSRQLRVAINPLVDRVTIGLGLKHAGVMEFLYYRSEK